MTALVWGCPWHGPVEGGQLTLPNDSKLEWPQPPGDTTDDAGFTLHARMPDVAQVERTEEELASDEAAGMQWLSSAIIAGAGKQQAADTGAAYLHGRNVNGWIYAAPDGSRWLVRGLGRRRMYSADLSMTLTLTRFGVLGGRSRSYSVSASISASQQDQASWSSSSRDTERDYRYWQVQDIGIGGDRAIVMTYVAKSKAIPLGFVLLTLSGTPGVDLAATLSKLAGRAEMVTDKIEADAGIAQYRGYYSYTEETIYSSWYPLDPLAYHLVRSYGGLEWVNASDPRPTNVEGFLTAHIGSGESRQAAKYLVAMWFDSDGVPVPVHLRVDNRAVMSFPVPSLSVSGRYSIYVTTGARTEYPDVDVSRSGAISESLMVELSFGGESVTFERNQNVTWSESYHLQGGEVEQASQRLPGSWRATQYAYSLASDSRVSSQWAVSGEYDWNQDNVNTPYWERTSNSVSGDHVPIGPDQGIPGTSGPAAVSAAVTVDGALLYGPVAWLYPAVRIVLRRHSNNLLCLQSISQHHGSSPQLITDPSIKISSRSISPAGVGPESAAEAASGTRYDAILPYGSHNPITGESAICRAEPVSWT